jgi:hypothetical protein
VSAALRRRAAEYLIKNRALNSALAGVRPRIFLKNKRVPVDSKSAHGKYATKILEEILVKAAFRRHDYLGPCISRSGSSQRMLTDSPDVFLFCREKEVESLSSPGVSISSESAGTGRKTAKRFDFVLLHGNSPKIVIEANFYTTGGTKIGINEKEYLALHEQVVQNEKGLRFIWVTDGGYWLTTPGRKDFLKLAPLFKQDLLNLAMFGEQLSAIKGSMRESTRSNTGTSNEYVNR